MTIFKTAARIMISGLVLGSVTLTAWCVTNKSEVRVQPESSAQTPMPDVRSWLERSPVSERPEAMTKCGPWHLYSDAVPNLSLVIDRGHR